MAKSLCSHTADAFLIFQRSVTFPVSSIRAGKAFVGTIMQAIAGCKE